MNSISLPLLNYRCDSNARDCHHNSPIRGYRKYYIIIYKRNCVDIQVFVNAWRSLFKTHRCSWLVGWKKNLLLGRLECQCTFHETQSHVYRVESILQYISINEPEFGKDVSIVFLIKVSKRVPYHGWVCVW